MTPTTIQAKETDPGKGGAGGQIQERGDKTAQLQSLITVKCEEEQGEDS